MTPVKSRSIRHLKPVVIRLIQTVSLNEAMVRIHDYPPLKVINVLISLLYHPDELIFWAAVTLIGEVVSHLADHQMESARTVMRRLMWSLNDESGGIGWGAPQAMGEIMARSRRMADEYGRILISYIQPAGNFIEHPALQTGVLWGLGRMLHARSMDQDADIQTALVPFLESPDIQVRGLAARIAAAIPNMQNTPIVNRLKNDGAAVTIRLNGLVTETTVGRLASGHPD